MKWEDGEKKREGEEWKQGTGVVAVQTLAREFGPRDKRMREGDVTSPVYTGSC